MSTTATPPPATAPVKKASTAAWIQNLIQEIQTPTKSALSNHGTEETSFPQKGVDDGMQAAKPGSQAAANDRLSKENNPGITPEAAKDNESGTAEKDLGYLQEGVHKAPSGKDPSVEDNYKDRPRATEMKPTSLTQASTETGPKYSADLSTDKALADAIVNTQALGDKLAASLAVFANDKVAQPSSNGTTAATPTTATTSATTAVQPNTVPAYFGYTTKQAADEAATRVFMSAIQEGEADAVKVAYVLAAELQQQQQTVPSMQSETPTEKAARKAAKKAKKAEKKAKAAVKAEPDAPGGPVPPPDALPPGAAPPGAGPPGAMPPGAMPPGAMPPGADAGPSGPGAGGPGAGGPPGGGEEQQMQALQQLVMALEELGLPLDKLMAGGGEGAPPAAAADGPKIANLVNAFKASGHFHAGQPAKTGSRKRQLRDAYKDYLRETFLSGK